MNALILGGMSPRHHEWVRQVAAALKPHFDEVRLHDYRHWGHEKDNMNLEYEIAQVAELVKDFGAYVIVAKSIGTAVAALAIARGLISPKRCVFVGFPLKAVETDMPEVAAALSQLPPTVFLHNQQDPLGSAEAVESYLRAHAPASYEFQIVPGATHDYVAFDLIARDAALQ
jgi:pimeloyl-ACP methyl ester carboxylesterase